MTQTQSTHTQSTHSQSTTIRPSALTLMAIVLMFALMSGPAWAQCSMSELSGFQDLGSLTALVNGLRNGRDENRRVCDNLGRGMGDRTENGADRIQFRVSCRRPTEDPDR